MKAYEIGLAVVLAIAPSPHVKREQSDRADYRGTENEVSSLASYIDDLCAYGEERKQQRCAELCSESETIYTVEGGVCGIGSTCTCN